MALSQPNGLVTTHADPQGRPTVFERLPPGLPRVVSVGRLDLNSEGLLLLTNDGGLAQRLRASVQWLAPGVIGSGVFGVVDPAVLARLANGLTIEKEKYGLIEAGLDSKKGDNAWLTVGLREGRNREIRKVMAHLGLGELGRLIRGLPMARFQLGNLEARRRRGRKCSRQGLEGTGKTRLRPIR